MKPVHVDGLLYFGMAVAGALHAGLGTDEAAKYVDPMTLFYARLFFDALGAGCLALKTYRSTSYGKHVEESSAKEIAQADPAKPA